MALNARSEQNLIGVHPHLIRVVRRAHDITPFIVTEGVRSLEKQKEYVAKGVSWTLKSRHLTGHAVDLVDTEFTWSNDAMGKIGKAMKEAAAELEIPIVWGALTKYGGDWKTRNDSPHFELDRKAYPAGSQVPVKDQIAEASKTKTAVGTGAAVAGGTVVSQAPNLPPPPDLTAVSAWKTFGDTLANLGAWAWSRPLITVGLFAFIGGLMYWPKIEALIRKWRAA
jgi:peptidoglycan L-alanyl-D-glutamate endopeptidase CwlK